MTDLTDNERLQFDILQENLRQALDTRALDGREVVTGEAEHLYETIRALLDPEDPRSDQDKLHAMHMLVARISVTRAGNMPADTEEILEYLEGVEQRFREQRADPPGFNRGAGGGLFNSEGAIPPGPNSHLPIS